MDIDVNTEGQKRAKKRDQERERERESSRESSREREVKRRGWKHFGLFGRTDGRRFARFDGSRAK